MDEEKEAAAPTTLRAKYQVQSVENFIYGQKVKATAVYDDGIPENKRFAQASPSGSFEILINNPPARDFYKPGAFFYLDSTIVPAA